jgi:hypothetical protein
LLCSGFESAIARVKSAIALQLRFVGYCDRLFWGYFGKAIANLFALGLKLRSLGLKLRSRLMYTRFRPSQAQ